MFRFEEKRLKISENIGYTDEKEAGEKALEKGYTPCSLRINCKNKERK